MYLLDGGFPGGERRRSWTFHDVHAPRAVDALPMAPVRVRCIENDGVVLGKGVWSCEGSDRRAHEV